MSFKITRYTPLNSEGNTIGFLSFTMTKTGMFYNDCKVIRRNTGDFFIGAPSRAYDGEDGVKRHSPFWGFEDRATSELFQQGLMEAVRAYWEAIKAPQAPQTPVQAPPTQITQQHATEPLLNGGQSPF